MEVSWQFLVNGAIEEYLGPCPAPREPHYTAILSHAYFCPTCGDVWARMAIPGRAWHAVTVPCERCPPVWSNRPAGSVILEWEPTITAALPEPVLRREARLHLAMKH